MGAISDLFSHVAFTTTGALLFSSVSPLPAVCFTILTTIADQKLRQPIGQLFEPYRTYQIVRPLHGICRTTLALSIAKICSLCLGYTLSWIQIRSLCLSYVMTVIFYHTARTLMNGGYLRRWSTTLLDGTHQYILLIKQFVL